MVCFATKLGIRNVRILVVRNDLLQVFIVIASRGEANRVSKIIWLFVVFLSIPTNIKKCKTWRQIKISIAPVLRRSAYE